MQAEHLVALLCEKKLTIASAESCTGGLLAAALTEVPGASQCFGYGLITYSNEAKLILLNLPAAVLEDFGAVSAEAAAAMACGVRELAETDLGVAITGIAGPGGATAQKPLGLVYICVCDNRGELVRAYNFSGSRQQVRAKSVAAALELIQTLINS